VRLLHRRHGWSVTAFWGFMASLLAFGCYAQTQSDGDGGSAPSVVALIALVCAGTRHGTGSPGRAPGWAWCSSCSWPWSPCPAWSTGWHTWPDVVPLGRQFRVREPVWTWGLGASLIDGGGSAIAAICVSLLLDAAVILVLFFLYKLIRNWLRHRRQAAAPA